MKNFNVKHADYHRNGISGDGYFIGIVEEEDGTEKMITFFEGIGQCPIAVVDLEEAVRGNIYMYPDPSLKASGGNAWRGDHYVEAANAIKAAVEAKWDSRV